MKRLACTAALAALATLFPLFLPAAAPPPPPDKAYYVPHYEDPVLKQMEEADRKTLEAREAKTRAIDDAQEALAKQEESQRKDLTFDMSKIARPSSPADFAVQGWHFPPVAQYLTGTCWSFSTTSYFESEVERLTGQRIKLSEMWTVYHEYLEKAKRYIETRGHSVFEEGSESEAIPRIWKSYGIVPESAYPGVLSPDGRYDHSQMLKEMQNYLAYCKEHDYWDEAQILDTLKLIMNRYMGAPPSEVKWEGKTYTPQQFLSDVLKLHLDDYVSFMSTESVPFWTQGEYKVEDNWWHDKSYYNVPLEVWYDALVKAVKAGSTVVIGGDVSEPGYSSAEKIAVIPSFDIPQRDINQDARELRFEDGATSDDHGIHLVGYKRMAGHDWFLIKDSARASRRVPPDGYFYYRDDYVKLKMLTYMVNKSFVKDVLARCTPAK